jgi:hypothetical protein
MQSPNGAFCCGCYLLLLFVVRFAVQVLLSVEGELVSYCSLVLMARELDCMPVLLVPLTYLAQDLKKSLGLGLSSVSNSMRLAMKRICFLTGLLLLLCYGDCMFTKKPMSSLEDIVADKRFKHDCVDLALSGEVSFKRSRRVMENSMKADPRYVEKLAKAGSSGKWPQNVARDMLKTLRKNSKWPTPYEITVRGFDRRVKENKDFKLELLLPHEVLKAVLSVNDIDKVIKCQKERQTSRTAAHVKMAKKTTKIKDILACGMWIDGVPYSHDRKCTVEIVSMGIVGFPDLCIPLTGVPKHFKLEDETMDDIFRVIAWSWRICLMNRMPKQRHDMTPFTPQDKKRKKMGGEEIGCSAILSEIRGDWSMFKETFRLPSWSSGTYICWLCSCCQCDLRDFSRGAKWRHERLDHYSFLRRQQELGKSLSTLMAAPFLTNQCFLPDWMHVMDLGVTLDFLGNLFKYLVDSGKLPGRNQELRTTALWKDIRDYYKRAEVPSKIPTLTHTMLLKEGGGKPKLRAKAGEARGLVPFAKEAAVKYLDPTDDLENALLRCAEQLDAAYECLRTFDAAAINDAVTKFALLYESLSTQYLDIDDRKFRVKPKLHLAMEISMMGDNPRDWWTYRDESFGGDCADMTRRRGGKDTPLAMSRTLIGKFVSQCEVPALV